ncbi:MAG: PhzF family phenazine biosynthesis protein [Rhodospirillaceae bacterium]|nr:PhzF family phenazine biosynthesis protein [Rhodospirillaceae bacterium]
MDAAIVAGCLSLAPGDIRMDRHAPTSASVGIPFFMVETDLASLSNARPDTNAFADALARHGDDNAVGRLSIFVYARKDEGVEQLRARMFSPLGGTVEDPATGSASAALGAFLMSLDPRADATAAIQIEQGVEMGRRSEIDVTVCKAQGNIDGVTVSGRCVPVMRGVIEI